MNKAEIVKKTINDIVENKGLEGLRGMTESTLLRDDLGFDSLDLAELTVRVEKETGIDVFADGIVHTVGQVIKRIS
jgi:acyl carrier protein